METIDFDKRVYYSQFPSGGDMAHHAWPHREVLWAVRRQKELGKTMFKNLYCGFHWKEWTR